MIEEVKNNSIFREELKTKFDTFNITGNNPFTKYYTYKLDNKYVGLINYDIIYERAELININVLKEYENKKIGSTLMEYMINDCEKNRIKSITLEVREDNSNAIHLYKKYGFKQVSIRKGYYNGVDALLMEKKLI